MGFTYTTNLNLGKPDYSEAGINWWSVINANFDKIDAFDIMGLAVTDGNFIVGDGTNWVAESGNTARTSLGLGTADSPSFAGLTVNTYAFTVNGAPTLNDWFDQSVKTTASPSFAGLIVDTTTLVVDSATSRVGVQIASPQKPLHVSNSIAISGGGPAIWFNETDGTKDMLFVLDLGICSFQRRTQTFGAFEAVPYRFNLFAPDNTFYSTPDGNVGLCAATTFGGAVGMVAIGNAITNPTTALSGAAGFYVSAGEMYAYDVAGNSTLLSPHDEGILNTLPLDVEFPFIYKSSNAYLGKEVIVDWGSLIKAVETLAGKTFMTVKDIPKRDWDTDQEALVLEREKEIEEAELKKEPAPESYIKKEIPVWIKSRLTKKVVEK